MATILVVDDEVVFCELLKTLLKGHGHDVLTANNGRQALELFKQHRPRFTMLDLRMPQMDGLEVLKHIRAIDTKAAVMILTAWGSDAMELQARKLGVTDFLSKSLSLDTIVASLQRGLMEPAEAGGAPKSPGEKTRASLGMLTANEDDALLKAALELGWADILGKPVEPERLLVAIQVGLVLLH